MATEAFDDDALYAALLARDPAFDGLAFAAVITTGVFCRLTCPARKPRRSNTLFFPSAGSALAAGFRPCLRCRPLAAPEDLDAVAARLVLLLDGCGARRWSERDLLARGIDPSTARRAFKRRFGVTFLHMARRRRLDRGLDRLASGAGVIEAQLDAGFDSASGFRAAVTRRLGRPPAAVLRCRRGDDPPAGSLPVGEGKEQHDG